MYFSKLFRFVNTIKAGYNCVKVVNTVRKSSQYKRPQLIPKKDQLCEVKETYFRNQSELTISDWKTVTEILIKNFKHINKNNVDAVIVGVCHDSEQLLLAKNYIKYLIAIGKQPNSATLGKLLRVYNAVYHTRGGGKNALTREEQEEILEICKKIRSKHDILDSSLCENLIYGLVATNSWKDSLELLEMMKITSNAPSSPAYTEIIIKAFTEKDLTLGWVLLHQMLEQRKQPKCEIFLALLNSIQCTHIDQYCTELEKLFVCLETHDIIVTEKVVKALEDFSKLHSNLMSVTRTNLKRFGKCSSCGLHMKNITLSAEDFKKLQDSFLQKVLIRKDIFQKSTPEEVEKFCNYIDRTGPYDCVIDGLNVAYSMGNKKPSQAFANVLASVVKYFQYKNKHVLVLGRQHMNNWPKRTMKYIKDNAAVFLASDMSQDDPFLLYAALKSGQTTDFFSRDLMRQHAYLLGPELKIIFRRWQQEHQYSLVTQTESGKIIVKEPIRYLICAHKIESTWHIPYKKEFTQHAAENFAVPDQWLCLRFLQ